MEVVEVARGDFCQHALSQGVTASGKNGLHDLIPLTVNEGLAVNAGVDQLLVLAQDVNGRVGLGAEDVGLSSDGQHAHLVQIHGVVLRILVSPLNALIHLACLKNSQGKLGMGVGKTRQGIFMAAARGLLRRNARNVDPQMHREVIFLLQNRNLVDHGVLEHASRRACVRRRLKNVVDAKNLAHLAVDRLPSGRLLAHAVKIVHGAFDLY